MKYSLRTLITFLHQKSEKLGALELHRQGVVQQLLASPQLPPCFPLPSPRCGERGWG